MEGTKAHALGAECGAVFLGKRLDILKHLFAWQYAKRFNNAKGNATGNALQAFVFLQFYKWLKQACDMAIKELNGRQVKGRALKVNEAKPREDRPPQRRPRY